MKVFCVFCLFFNENKSRRYQHPLPLLVSHVMAHLPWCADLLTYSSSGLWRQHWDPEWLLWYFITSTKAQNNMEISPIPKDTSNRSLMCKYLSTSSDAVPLSITNSVNTLCCRHSLSADFIFLYPFALLKLWLHVVLDSLFSLVVISALYLIRVAAFLQDKLSDVRKAYGILENTSISSGSTLTFMHMCTRSLGNWHTASRLRR